MGSRRGAIGLSRIIVLSCLNEVYGTKVEYFDDQDYYFACSGEVKRRGNIGNLTLRACRSIHLFI